LIVRIRTAGDFVSGVGKTGIVGRDSAGSAGLEKPGKQKSKHGGQDGHGFVRKHGVRRFSTM
jgi:hypothetical protein